MRFIVSLSDNVPQFCELLVCVANNGAIWSRNRKKRNTEKVFRFFGAPAENRTPDTLIKSQKTQFSDVLRLCRMHKRKRHQSASCGTDRGSAHDAAGEKSPPMLYTLHKLATRTENREVKRGREDMLTNFLPRVLAKKLGGIPD